MAPDLRPTVPVPPPAPATPEVSLANKLRLLAWDLERGAITTEEALAKMAEGLTDND